MVKYSMADLDWIESHELMVGAVAPRPIALVSTLGENGVFNVAPFGFYGLMHVKPAIVYLGIGIKRQKKEKKDTARNIEFSREFVINVVDEALAERMNQCAAEYPSDVSEFNEVGLTPVKGDLVKAPMVGESPINMECKLIQTLRFGKFPDATDIMIGEVLRVHVRDDILVDGAIDPSRLKAIARLGREWYCRTTDIFEMKRPYLGLS